MKNKYKLSFSFLFLLTTLFVQAQTAEEIIDKHVEVLGGKKKLTAIKSVKRVFKTDSEFAPGGSAIMAVDQGARVESQTLFGTSLVIVNKKKGWSIIQTPLDEKPEIKEMNETDRSGAYPSIDLDLDKVFPWSIITSYIRYGSSKHISFTLLGKETVDGKECFKLKIKYVSSETWYIDGNTWNLVKVEGGTRDEPTITRYSEFRKDANGILLPYKEEAIGKDGKVLITSTNSEFETNIKVDKSVFTYKP
jgi:hypothetical protein